MNDSELYSHQKHYNNLLEKYKCVFINKARQTGGTTFGIHKAVQKANEKPNSYVLILTMNNNNVTDIHRIILNKYSFSKTSSPSNPKITFDNGSIIEIDTYNHYLDYSESKLSEPCSDFIFLDEPNHYYKMNPILEYQINEVYKCQVLGIGTGGNTTEYQSLIDNAPFKCIDKTPWYKIQNEEYLKNVDFMMFNMPMDKFNIEFRCNRNSS